MVKVRVDTRLSAPPDVVWTLLQQSETLVRVAKPLLYFRPIVPPHLPLRWERRSYRVSMYAFGVLPLGQQTITIEEPDAHPEAPSGARILRDNGSGQLVSSWDHWIFVSSHPDGGAAYTDWIDIQAGILTPLIKIFAEIFYRHRQRRWRQVLAEKKHLLPL